MASWWDNLLCACSGTRKWDGASLVAAAAAEEEDPDAIEYRYNQLLQEEEERLFEAQARRKKRRDEEAKKQELEPDSSRRRRIVRKTSSRYALVSEMSDDEAPEGFEPQSSAAKSIKVGVEFFTEEDFDVAKAHLKRAVRLAAENRNELLQARALGNVANVYETLMESRKAAKYYQLCIQLLRRLGDAKREAFVLSNAMVSYIQLKEYDVALELAERKLELTSKPRKRKETERWIEKLRKAVNGEVALDFDGEQMGEA